MFKTFSTEASAKSALKKAGLHGLPAFFHKTVEKGKLRFLPVVTVESEEDRAYVESHHKFECKVVRPTNPTDD